MSGIVEFTVGTTFNVPITYTPVAGIAPADLANTTITSQIRKADGGLVCALSAAKAGDNMSFMLLASGGTASWPHDITARWDIKFSDTVFGDFFSDKTDLRLVQPVTR